MYIYRPNELEVQRVMRETGMEKMQAYRHLQQRHSLLEQLARHPAPNPLGKSQMDAR